MLFGCSKNASSPREILNFGNNWRFSLGEQKNAECTTFIDSLWRTVDLPHDWSIEGHFNSDHPESLGGSALAYGIGWYRKTFLLTESDSSRLIFIDFDGIYRNSDVWINGHHLGFRPNGFVSFRYELTPYLNFGLEPNVITVRVDNPQQPNPQWYTGSGIYRNVWLVKTGALHVDHWGTHITAHEISKNYAKLSIGITLSNRLSNRSIGVVTTLVDQSGMVVASASTDLVMPGDTTKTIVQHAQIVKPNLWSVTNPYLYTAITQVSSHGEVIDTYKTEIGIRSVHFDSERGFFLNNEPLKILGVNLHYTQGSLGATVYQRALERQLGLLRAMGCNAIQTVQNPPAPELLDLCNRMGFLVVSGAFETWRMGNSEYGYHQYRDQWHSIDLDHMVRRDRNNPSIIMWSIGNEVEEQHDSTGYGIARRLVDIVKSLDSTRPITAAFNFPHPNNHFIQADVLDVIGINYHHELYPDLPSLFPGKKFIASRTTSAFATRGHYDLPSDVKRIWPVSENYSGPKPNPDYTCSSYDHCHPPWGLTHAEAWRAVSEHDFISGMFIWTGFDYLGEPIPYAWPARSSYSGIIDLAGFPKDAYYMYQSEWTTDPVLHLFPHWNWAVGDTVDVWVYTNAQAVELFLNGHSLGLQPKVENKFHLKWRVPFTEGVIEAVAHSRNGERISKSVKTSGEPARIALSADRANLSASGTDLAFITVEVHDAQGVPVPYADTMIGFEVNGPGRIVGVDNGNPVSHEPFKASHRKAFRGKCLAIIRANAQRGSITLTAHASGLESASVTLNVH